MLFEDIEKIHVSLFFIMDKIENMRAKLRSDFRIGFKINEIDRFLLEAFNTIRNCSTLIYNADVECHLSEMRMRKYKNETN